MAQRLQSAEAEVSDRDANAIIYTTTVRWERCHVAHHLAACAAPEAEPQEPSPGLSDAA